jgi:hypothetical protein
MYVKRVHQCISVRFGAKKILFLDFEAINLFSFAGCMYSMAAFGPVLGFLLGAYLLSFHMDSFAGTVINIGEFNVSKLFIIIGITMSKIKP